MQGIILDTYPFDIARYVTLQRIIFGPHLQSTVASRYARNAMISNTQHLNQMVDISTFPS